MKIARFDPPGNNNDFAEDQNLADQYSRWLSNEFDVGVASVTAFLAAQGGGACQFYNPVTHGDDAPDLAHSLGDITWNGFPKRFSSTGPGHPTQYADAEPAGAASVARPQDEYLEWFVNQDAAGKITSIHFTCEAWDFFEFLGASSPAKVLDHYTTFISPDVQQADLFKADGSYDRLNKWNTALGAMHLTHNANNLFAETFLAASATVRRQRNGTELTSSIPLINCAEYGDASRNSDPNIGIAVNGLAREKRMITLANPVGLYMSSFDGSGITLNGQPAGGFFKVLRGAFPLALRAEFKVPDAAAAAGLTVSDVKVGGGALRFGGQLAERVTMHLIGVASVARAVDSRAVACGAIQQVDPAPAHLVAALGHLAHHGVTRKDG
jgi:hypothetical protein